MNNVIRKKPIYRMTQSEILGELINLLKKQAMEKNRRFLSKEKNNPKKPSAYESYLELIDKCDKMIYYIDHWKEDISYLKKIEGYIEPDPDEREDAVSYYNMIISMLYDLDELTEEQKQFIINDEKLAAKLLQVRAKLLVKKADLESVPFQVKTLTDIIDLLKEHKEDDYIDEDLINMIYAYYQSEQYTRYEDKVLNVGTYIVNYNLLVHQKRTSR